MQISVVSKSLLAAFGCIIIICLSTVSHAAYTHDGMREYEKNVHLLPLHKQKLADDITRYRNADNLWDVLRDEFSLPHHEESYAVQVKIEWYMNNQDYLLRVASRAAPYLYYISQQVRKRRLPAELALLPIVESGYNPFSVSSMGASGLWQLMPDTATGLGVKHDWAYDGRRDVIASTQAALSYLAYLQSFFEGNWLLAIAAYNTGEGNVLAAIKRNIRDGKDTDFWSLPLASETRDYVPSILALAVIISRPDKYPVYLPPIRNAPYLAQVNVGQQINLKYAAKYAGIGYQRLLTLNPGYNSNTTSSKAPYKIILPIEKVEQFTENLARSAIIQPANWLHYRVKSGDTLASISKKYRANVTNIRRMNHLASLKLKPGTTLLIPSQQHTPSAEELEDAQFERELLHIKTPVVTHAKSNKYAALKRRIKATKELAIPIYSVLKPKKKYEIVPGDTIYMVRKSDTVDKIAKRYHVTLAALREANQFTSNKLTPGKQIVIPTHQPVHTASNIGSTTPNITPGDTVYMVRHGDTIEKIAKKFKITASKIRISNLIDNDLLSEGEEIIIPTHYRG